MDDCTCDTMRTGCLIHPQGLKQEPVRILGIDPGKTTGWAELSLQGRSLHLGMFGSTKDKTLVEIMPLLKEADVIIYEGWWTRPSKAQKGAFDWKPMEAPEVIGSLLTLCKILEKKQVIKQQPSSKVPGYSFAGMKYVKGKQGTHWQDALAHATFYAVTKLKALPVGSDA